MQEEAEGHRRESIRNRWGESGRRGKTKWRRKKKSRRKDRRQCVYQQTFGCCQLTARALGYQRKETELYNQAVKAGREGESDRQTENKTGTRTKKKNKKKHWHLKWQGQHDQRKNKHRAATIDTRQKQVRVQRDGWWEVKNTSSQMWTQVRGYYIHHVCII